MLTVFLIQLGKGWWVADSPFRYIMMIDAGLSPEEIDTVNHTMNIVWTVLSWGTSIGLLLLNYFLGKRYKLTKESTIVYIFLLILFTLLGHFLGYAVRQLQIPQFPILFLGIFMIPIGSLPSITWNLLGMLAGNYVRIIREKGN